MASYHYKVTVEGKGALDIVHVELSGEDIEMFSNDGKKWVSATTQLTFEGNLTGKIKITAISGTDWEAQIENKDNNKKVFSDEGTTESNHSTVDVDVNPS